MDRSGHHNIGRHSLSEVAVRFLVCDVLNIAQVLFNGDGEIAQMNKIFALLGTPTEANWPGVKELKVMKQASAFLFTVFFVMGCTAPPKAQSLTEVLLCLPCSGQGAGT